MDTFYDAFGIVAALCAGIIILAVFFSVVGYFKTALGGAGIVKLNGFVRDGKLTNLHLDSGQVWQGVRFVGVINQNSIKGGAIPYQFANIVVFESLQGARLWIRADAIKAIEELDDPD